MSVTYNQSTVPYNGSGYTYNGLIPHAKLMHSIEALHTRVLPRVT